MPTECVSLGCQVSCFRHGTVQRPVRFLKEALLPGYFSYPTESTADVGCQDYGRITRRRDFCKKYVARTQFQPGNCPAGLTSMNASSFVATLSMVPSNITPPVLSLVVICFISSAVSLCLCMKIIVMQPFVSHIHIQRFDFYLLFFLNY